jgi:cephalosporin-C deacetylase-like acetyl esterase
MAVVASGKRVKAFMKAVPFLSANPRPMLISVFEALPKTTNYYENFGAILQANNAFKATRLSV